jgi:protein O-GlcNAc transferase
MQVGRNDPCPCGSGKKYKKCCLASDPVATDSAPRQISKTQRVEIVNSALAVGDTPRARRELEPLLRGNKVNAELWALACKVELRDKNFAGATQSMARAVALEPKRPSYWYNYGTALALDGQLEKAVESFHKALALDPGMSIVYPNLGHALRDLGRSDEAVACYKRAFREVAGNLSTMSQILVSMHLFTTSEHDLLYEMHKKLGGEITARSPTDSPHRDSIQPREKIRVGYVSPRFSREIVSYFFKPLFDHHDRSRFEIYLYCATSRTDDMTRYFAERADKWIEIGKLSDAETCQRIVTDEIDILIDLAGHAPESRITMMARKPAPIQISMLDYFDTTGVAAIDYYVTDRFSTPEDSRQKFTEQLLYLEHPRLVYEAPDYAPEPIIRESRANDIVFGSFNRPHKIVPGVVDAWSRLLRDVPESRLLLKGSSFASGDVCANFRQRFAACGIDKDRIEFRPASPHREMLAEYGDMDIALDTFPYNGGLTTCEALWMGTPVITMLGERIISRQTAGMLDAVGLGQFIAQDEEEFAQIGKYWATHRDELKALRQQLRATMAESPLTDASSYTADFEGQLEKIYSDSIIATPIGCPP